MRGPIDYLIIGFEGGEFKGDVLQALKDAVEEGIINVLALLVVKKDSDGNVTTVDLENMGDEYLLEITESTASEQSPVSEEDVEEIADLLAEDTAAGLLVFEHVWAIPLKKSLIDAGGFLVSEGRIHPEAAKEFEMEGA